MQEIQTRKCIFKKRRSLRRVISVKIIAAFLVGIICGFYLSEGKTLAMSYFEQISVQIAYNTQ